MNATAIASARLIGEIFVDEGLITDEQLELALEEQQTTEQRLGEILIARFGVSRVELSSALLKQLAEHERSTVPNGDGPDSGSKPTSEAGGEKKLEKALRLQRKTGQRLGTILFDQGVLPRAKLTGALSEQLASLDANRPPSSQRAETSGGTPARLAEESDDLRMALDELQERLEHAQSAAGQRLDEVEQRLADVVTPAELNERVNVLTSGMLELGRLSEELASRLSSNADSGIDTVAGEVKELRAQLAEHGHKELAGVVERMGELEARLSSAAMSAELDEKLERALTAHVAQVGFGLDALAHSMKQVASSADLNRLRKTVDLLSVAADGANELTARRLAQLEARSEEAVAAADRLQAALSGTANESAAAHERLRESIVEFSDGAERRLTEERSELHVRLGREMQKLQSAAAENLSSLRGAIDGLATQLVEQRRHLEAQAREDVARLDGQIEEQEARAEEHAADAARATGLLEQDIQRLEGELRVRLERHAGRIDEQRRSLEEVRKAGEHALQTAAARLTQRLADVEQDAVASTDGLRADLGQLGEQVAGQAVASAQESAAARADLDHLRSRLDDLNHRLKGNENRTAGDAAKAQKELDEVRSGIDALGARIDAYGGDTTRHLDAVRDDLGRLQIQVEQLPVRLDDEMERAADATTAVRSDLESVRKSLAERQAAAEILLGEKIGLLAERSTVESLRERLDEHDERIAESRLWHHELSTELGRRLSRLNEEAQSRFGQIESGQQRTSAELKRTAASLREEQDELAATLREEQERSVSSLLEEVGEREVRTLAALSDHRTSLAGAGIELARLRQDVVESDGQRRQGDEALEARVDELRGEIALALKKLAEAELERRRGDDALNARIDRFGHQLASESAKSAKASATAREALRDGLSAVSGRLEEVEQRSQDADEAVSFAIGQIERDLGDVAVRSAAHAAESQRELREEFARPADSQATLLSRIEEQSQAQQTQEARLARAEEALESLGVVELRAEVRALRNLLNAQELQARAEAETADELRGTSPRTDSKRFRRKRTFKAAGDDLMKAFEEPGQRNQRADLEVAQRGFENDEEPTANGQSFLAFAPDAESRYTMVVCSGEHPSVGAKLELAEIGGGPLVVTRVADSPLPHDTRRCVYLERAF